MLFRSRHSHRCQWQRQDSKTRGRHSQFGRYSQGVTQRRFAGACHLGRDRATARAGPNNPCGSVTRAGPNNACGSTTPVRPNNPCGGSTRADPNDAGGSTTPTACFRRSS